MAFAACGRRQKISMHLTRPGSTFIFYGPASPDAPSRRSSTISGDTNGQTLRFLVEGPASYAVWLSEGFGLRPHIGLGLRPRFGGLRPQFTRFARIFEAFVLGRPRRSKPRSLSFFNFLRGTPLHLLVEALSRLLRPQICD